MNRPPANPPYPRFGECLRTLALAFDTKAGNHDVDRLARQGDYDWSLLRRLTGELLLAPLARYVDPGFAALLSAWLEHMQVRYRELVLDATVDSLGRPAALPILVSTFFAPQAAGLLVAARKDWGGPELARLLDPACDPVAVAMEWLNAGEATPLAKVAFPGTTGQDRAAYEKVRKWTRGVDVPSLAGIRMFADALGRSAAVGEEKTVLLRRWLLLARALAYLDRQWPAVPVRKEMLRYLLSGMPDIDVPAILWQAVQDHAGRYAAMSSPALALYEDLERTTPKEAGAQERTRQAIDALASLMTEHDPEGNTAFHLAWLEGRWHVLSGRFGEALGHYEHAVELASYRAGKQLASILEEGLALAAFLNDKPCIKRFKHQAVAAGLFVEPQGQSVIERWEIDQVSQQFHRLFPHAGRFPEAPLHDEQEGLLGLLVLDEEALERMQPDLARPDRVRAVRFLGGEVRRQPQLLILASQGKVSEVARLLEQGASVDQLDDAGGSALLCAMQYAERSGDRRTLDLLLDVPHAAATLDSMTAKKQITPLFFAIGHGQPDVVEKLLRMGAAADRRANIVDQTPLHHVIETLGAIRSPARLRHLLSRSRSADRDLVRQDVLRRHGVSLAGVFGDGSALQRLRENEDHEAIFQEVIDFLVRDRLARHSEAALLRMAELLLQHGANPNARHAYPAPGRTPLMLAAENDSAAAFDMLLRGGGDPFLADAQGCSSMTLALGFRSANVVRYLRTRNIM